MVSSNYKSKNIEREYINAWCDWLINYIREPINKIKAYLKDIIIGLQECDTW